MMKPRIVVVGSSNTDMTVLCRRLPAPGETVIGGEFMQAGGGKGANQAVAAARAGAQVAFVGRVGDDAFGRQTIEALRREGIATDFIVVDNLSPSGVALIMVDGRGENMIVVAPGANGRVCPADVERARPALEKAGAVLVQLETPVPAVEAALGMGRRAGAITVLNPAPAPDGGLERRLLADVSVLTPNRTEAAQLLGADADEPPERLARGLLEMGVGAVALTLGADGVVVCDGGRCEHVPAAPARVVDTVGAGDCFSAVLGVGLAEGRSLLDAARLAVCAAALACEVKGAQPSMPGRADIERRFASVFSR
jgi:ribokinase